MHYFFFFFMTISVVGLWKGAQALHQEVPLDRKTATAPSPKKVALVVEKIEEEKKIPVFSQPVKAPVRGLEIEKISPEKKSFKAQKKR
ncbi:MAG: hypothetical protein CL678_18940 [Bdellovibrionaceae bacterium]|nr:hypothetical protein [Pseudobdellovibrionaceae bacterium]